MTAIGCSGWTAVTGVPQAVQKLKPAGSDVPQLRHTTWSCCPQEAQN
jgi:hypothetical protein